MEKEKEKTIYLYHNGGLNAGRFLQSFLWLLCIRHTQGSAGASLYGRNNCLVIVV